MASWLWDFAPPSQLQAWGYNWSLWTNEKLRGEKLCKGIWKVVDLLYDWGLISLLLSSQCICFIFWTKQPLLQRFWYTFYDSNKHIQEHILWSHIYWRSPFGWWWALHLQLTLFLFVSSKSVEVPDNHSTISMSYWPHHPLPIDPVLYWIPHGGHNLNVAFHHTVLSPFSLD